MTEVAERFPRIEEKIGLALKAVEGDGSASPVLVAVVREFDSKARKAKQAITTGDQAAREAVIELEQAGDSAKAATEADPSIGEGTKQAVLDAHLAICVMKSKLDT